MEDDEDGDTLSKHQEEQLQKFIAQMNVYSQHKKVIAEAARRAKEAENNNTTNIKIMKKG